MSVFFHKIARLLRVNLFQVSYFLQLLVWGIPTKRLGKLIYLKEIHSRDSFSGASFRVFLFSRMKILQILRGFFFAESKFLKFCVDLFSSLQIVYVLHLIYYTFLYKQLVYKQLALGWQIAKQLSGINPSFTKQQ